MRPQPAAALAQAIGEVVVKRLLEIGLMIFRQLIGRHMDRYNALPS
jgi:hypothetical protein